MIQSTPTLQKLAEFERPTSLGISANVVSYSHQGEVVFAVSWGDIRQDRVLVRVHSPCLFGESFGVNSCDCAQQLHDAMEKGANNGSFLLIYLSNQEGRGHGLQTKIAAIAIEANHGKEMPEAFEELGLEMDLRDYGAAASIIKMQIGDHSIRLLTNNPKKTNALRSYGIEVDQQPLIVQDPIDECRRYMRSKRRAMGHDIPDDF